MDHVGSRGGLQPRVDALHHCRDARAGQATGSCSRMRDGAPQTVQCASWRTQRRARMPITRDRFSPVLGCLRSPRRGLAGAPERAGATRSPRSVRASISWPLTYSRPSRPCERVPLVAAPLDRDSPCRLPSMSGGGPSSEGGVGRRLPIAPTTRLTTASADEVTDMALLQMRPVPSTVAPPVARRPCLEVRRGAEPGRPDISRRRVGRLISRRPPGRYVPVNANTMAATSAAVPSNRNGTPITISTSRSNRSGSGGT